MQNNPYIIFKDKGQVALESTDIPVAGADQLLIKTRKTMISTGTELSILEKKNVDSGSYWDTYGAYPFLPGYNNIGIVVDAGPGVDREWIGRRVATYGTHAAYTVAKVSEARPVRDDVDDDAAVFFTIAEIVMQGIRRSRIMFGETAAVFGLGLLGQITVRMCKICGAKPVAAIDISPYRLSLLPKDGSVIPVHSLEEDVVESVAKISRGRMADVVFEVTGAAALLPSELNVIRDQGRFVILSSPAGKTLFDFHDLCNKPSIEIIGAHNKSHTPVATPDNPWTLNRDAELFFDMIADGDMDLKPLISHRAKYTDACELYHMLMADRSGAMGVILEWE